MTQPGGERAGQEDAEPADGGPADGGQAEQEVVEPADGGPIGGGEPADGGSVGGDQADDEEGGGDAPAGASVIIENIGGIGKTGDSAAAKAGSEDADVSASPPAEVIEEMPWSKGVPMEQRRRARELFKEGNKRARDGYYATAESRYDDAIALWGHPAFYYNRALVQLRLGEHLDAYQSLEEAMRYENAPLGVGHREEGERHLVAIENEMTRIVITCDVPGAKVTLNGKDLFIGPGRFESIEEPGSYRIIADKPGYLADSREILFMAGERHELDMQLRYERQERRWGQWGPWVAVLGGAALLGAGGYAHVRAARGFDGLRDDFLAVCPGMCEPSNGNKVDRDDAERWRLGAAVGYVAGGVALTAGVVLLYLNRERRVEYVVEADAPRLSITPMLTPDSAGVSAIWQF